jgi:quinolinate synthase
VHPEAPEEAIDQAEVAGACEQHEDYKKKKMMDQQKLLTTHFNH